MADDNGVLVIPQGKVDKVLELAMEYKAIEEKIVEAIRRGDNPVEAHERVNYDFMTRSQQ